MTATHTTGPEASIIGKYQLIANLGHGGMADVFLAIAHGPVGFNKLMVIKRLRPSLAEEPEFLSMFLDEARLAARLNHPNVVQTNEVGEADGVFFIAMEYLDGQPLNRILHRAIKHGGLPRELLLRVVADALAGMHHAHELTDYDGTPIGVVHRDASPHNIFVTYEGQTKVVDFGIAKAATRSAETRGGILKGKIAYMAPEQARSEAVDRRSDIYAMGLVLYEVLTGARLRKGSELEMLDKISHGDPASITTAWPECPAELSAIFVRATALKKEDRYATANEMRQDIVAYLTSTGVPSTAEDAGKFITALFESKRTEMKAIIEKQLSGLRRAASGEGSVGVVDARKLGTDSMELPRANFGSLVNISSQPSNPTHPTHPTGPSTGGSLPEVSNTGVSAAPATTIVSQDRSRLRGPLLIVAIGLAAAITVLALRRGSDPKPNGAATPGSAGVTASAGSQTSAAPAFGAPTGAPTSAAVSTIEVHLSAKPPQAKLFLDDTALPSNPYSGKFRRDDKAHTFRVEAEGFASATRSLSFASDQTLEVSMDRAEGPKAGPQPGPQSPPSDAVPRPTARPRRPLDDDDPWKKPGQ